jgi:putative membrane-bound dehydrogenase-like protein
MSTRRLTFLLLTMPVLPVAAANFEDRDSDLSALPEVPPEFEVRIFAREPLVRNVCSLAFDERGRLFVSHGPQYRKPTPETPPDSIVIVQDRDGDGTADATHTFATGFNCIQGLAWRGRDLWVANAPDLTVVRDTNGDDVADEYVRVFTDLGNIEHGIHGLVWAPDGKLYMTKGNSKGVVIKAWKQDEPDRIAPKPFRELWNVPGPPDAPDFPEPKTFTAATYKSTYQNPDDDWGRMGGILRCDDMGKNLEIVARGCRNPYGLAFDHHFNWLAVDQDQNEGDRILMPFFGADFGWGHAWSTHWTGENHLPSVPVSGPTYQGSGTGVNFADAPNWPEKYRGVFLINDWLLKKTYLYRPEWQGALLQPKDGKLEEFIIGKNALYRPVDMAFGPDGALYITGWGRGYGVERDAAGSMTNEGRIFRIAPKGVKPLPPLPEKKLADMSVDELVAEFESLLPVRRVNAQEELVRRLKTREQNPPNNRGLFSEIANQLLNSRPQSDRFSGARRTWCLWALGRSQPKSDAVFGVSAANKQNSEALRIQSLNIIGMFYPGSLLQKASFRTSGPVTSDWIDASLRSELPRVRLAAVQALHQAKASSYLPDLIKHAAEESDRIVFYATWRAMRDLGGEAALRPPLKDTRGGVRCAALLGLLDLGAMKPDELNPLTKDSDARVSTVALLGLGKKAPAAPVAVKDAPDFPLGTNLAAESGHAYAVGLLKTGQPSYTDRQFVFKKVPDLLGGAQIIRTANEDDGSRGQAFLTFDLALPCTVSIAHDTRIIERPAWMQGFADTDLTVTTSDTTFHLWSKDFPAGNVTLGGNLAGPSSGGKAHYFVVLQPKPLTPPAKPTSAEEVIAALEKADRKRGEALFFHNAGCAACHRVGNRGINHGPDLTNLGDRMEAKFIVQAMLDPSAVITEGFASHYVEAGGKSYQGVLLATGKTLKLGLAGGETVEISEKDITKHETLPVSPMPPQGAVLSAPDAADITAWLLSLREGKNGTDGTHGTAESPLSHSSHSSHDTTLSAEQKPDRLLLKHGADPLGEYVFADTKTLRPFFANLRAPGGIPVTRTWPPVPGVDAVDHADMHPGVWLAFGVVSGEDFWRNKAAIKHQRFTAAPEWKEHSLRFATLSIMHRADGGALADMACDFTLTTQPGEYRLTWAAAITPLVEGFFFGDQEEMGLGVRVATALTEKNGGVITSSSGATTAKATWGQAAEWCDYTGVVNGVRAGVKIIPDPGNFRPCWWHNRDYGVFVANPFGRAAMKQGEPSRVEVKKGATHRLKFTVVLHATAATR